jgi:hypothetical protein
MSSKREARKLGGEKDRRRGRAKKKRGEKYRTIRRILIVSFLKLFSSLHLFHSCTAKRHSTTCNCSGKLTETENRIRSRFLWMMRMWMVETKERKRMLRSHSSLSLLHSSLLHAFLKDLRFSLTRKQVVEQQSSERARSRQ